MSVFEFIFYALLPERHGEDDAITFDLRPMPEGVSFVAVVDTLSFLSENNGAYFRRSMRAWVRVSVVCFFQAENSYIFRDMSGRRT